MRRYSSLLSLLSAVYYSWLPNNAKKNLTIPKPHQPNNKHTHTKEAPVRDIASATPSAGTEPTRSPEEEARDILATAAKNQAEDGPNTRRAAVRACKYLRLQHRNPSRMLNSGNIFFTILIWFWIRFDDMNLICFEFGVMISIWFWYGFDTILIRFWYDFDMILIRFWYGSSELASKKETETAQG